MVVFLSIIVIVNSEDTLTKIEEYNVKEGQQTIVDPATISGGESQNSEKTNEESEGTTSSDEAAKEGSTEQTTDNQEAEAVPAEPAAEPS